MSCGTSRSKSDSNRISLALRVALNYAAPSLLKATELFRKLAYGPLSESYLALGHKCSTNKEFDAVTRFDARSKASKHDRYIRGPEFSTMYRGTPICSKTFQSSLLPRAQPCLHILVVWVHVD